MKIEVFKRLLTEEYEVYGVKLSIGNQSFKIDYYGDREEAQWMKDMLIQAINNLITKTREETIKEGIEQIEDLRKAIANQVGLRYDEHYENCIDILNKLKK